MSLAKASLWTAASTLVKIGAGLLVGKLLAVSFGPAGLGLAANFRQLITVLGVLAGAGIFNGVTKYVAQYHDNPQQLRRVVGTSSAMVLGFSTLMALVFVLAAAPISQGLFGNTDYQGLVRLVALVQMGIAWGNLLLALMKGFRDAAGNALSLIVGSLIGVLAYYVSYRLGGYEGALLGLALIPALVVIPAVIMLIKRGVIPLSYLKPSWDNGLAGQLSKFITGVYYYSNIASPTLYDGEALKYIDYDLDLKVFPDGNYRILDQEEYRQHAREMGYSDELDKILKKQLDVLIDLAVKKGGPFDQNFTKKWYGFYQDLKEGYYGKSDYYK